MSAPVAINFFLPNIKGVYYKIAKNLKIESYSIVINLSHTPALIEENPKKFIYPQKSVILKNTVISSAQHLIVIEIIDRANIGTYILQPEWQNAEQLFGEKFKGVALWRSPVQTIASISLNPFKSTESLCNGKEVEVEYDIKTNLWFATQNVNCGIHNKHSFIEYHTQLYGIGRMQKFKEQNADTLYEECILAEGNTHDVFCQAIKPDQYVYPWHQYYSDTDCIWIVFELHPKQSG